MPETSSDEKVVAYKTKPMKGNITRQFTVWCGVCEGWDMLSANGLDNFINQITEGKKPAWRLTRDYGWCHTKCCKIMPTQLKF